MTKIYANISVFYKIREHLQKGATKSGVKKLSFSFLYVNDVRDSWWSIIQYRAGYLKEKFANEIIILTSN